MKLKMKLTDKRIIYSSEKCEITLGEFENKQYIEKTCDFPNDAIREIARIDSPYIAKICEIGDDYLITEYADGFSLSSRRIPPKEVFRVALELCDALSALHEKNVIHRDVKPSNIIMCNDGHIKLIDFDTARLKKITSDKDTRFIGTDGFAPPEQYGFMQTDERSDIYSFGVTIKLLLEEDYAHCPYKRVIEKCIRFNPEQRFSSIKAVKTALKCSRVMPFVILPLCGAVAAASCIVLLNYGLSSKPVVPENISTSDNIPDSVYSETETSSTSSSQSSSNQISSTSSSTASPQSSISTSKTSSTTSQQSSTSVPNKSSMTSSQTNISVSSTSSTTSSQSSKPASTTTSSTSIIVKPIEKPIELPIKTEKEYDVGWDLLIFPEGCPKFVNSVDYYTFGDFFSEEPFRFFIKWYSMSKEDIEMLVRASHEYLGEESTLTTTIESFNYFSWTISNPEYKIIILWGGEEEPIAYFNIYPLSDKFIYPPLNLKLADPTITDTQKRKLKWEIASLPNYIPKLSDYVTSVQQTNKSYKITWQIISLAETEYYIQKMVDSFNEPYKYKMQASKNGLSWYFNTTSNGVPVDITFEYRIDSKTNDIESSRLILSIS
ncbi:MAG: serine/threonine-protein kinase [Oscillospiraceae bacterium]